MIPINIQGHITNKNNKAFVLEIQTVVANDTITLPVSGGTFDATVDWGDGTVDTLDSHEYAVAGTYEISIDGTMTGWSTGGKPFNQQVIKVLNWGLTGLTDISFHGSSNLQSIVSDYAGSFTNISDFINMFYYCQSLVNIPVGLFDYATSVTSFANCFFFCNSITTEIPNGLFDNNTIATDFTATFYNCANIPNAIPDELFKYNTQATSFYDTFRSCTSITSVPSNLFATNTLAESFRTTFLGFTIADIIPMGLFDNCTAATSFRGTFWGSDFTSIPSDLFDGCPNVTNFEHTFRDMVGLTSIPSGLFDNNILANNFVGSFYNCSGITTIPTGLFDNNPIVTNFGATFQECSSLTNIPSGLFDNNPDVTSFVYTFRDCSSIASAIPTDLFKFNTLVIHFYGTFLNCSNITAIPSGLFDTNTVAENFGFGNSNGTFQGCSSLTSIPDNLFAYTTSAWRFNYLFSGCSGLVGEIPSNLFSGCIAADEMWYVFNACTGITSIGVGLLDPCVNVTKVYGMFANCNMTSIHPEIFKYNVNITTFGLQGSTKGVFHRCLSLTEIPSGLFDTNVLATHFVNIFYQCTGLNTPIPEGLFDSQEGNITTIERGFQGCSNIPGLAPDLWNDYADDTVGSICFANCNFDNQAAIPTYWGGQGSTYALDVNPAQRGYSLRRLRLDATNSITIRRDNDDAETDVILHDTDSLALTSFVTAGGDLTTWVGSNSAYVKTIFDQGLDGEDFNQTTNALQPKVIDAGALIMKDGEPAIEFISADETIMFATNTGDQSGWLFTVSKNGTSDGGIQISVAEPSSSVSSFSIYSRINSGNTLTVYDVLSVFNSYESDFDIDDMQYLGVTHSDGSSTDFYINSIAQTTNITAGSDTGRWFGDWEYPIYMGGVARLNDTYADGFFQEVIMYSNDISDKRVEIENEIMDFYGFNYLINKNPTIERAYSFRRLSRWATYSVTIRRDNDDAETSVLLDIVGGLELTSEVSAGGTLATWVGANSAYVKTWHDQSLSGEDATQTVLASQPKIIDAGALIIEDGDAVIDFDGVDDYLQGTSVSSTIGSAFLVGKNSDIIMLSQANPSSMSDIFFIGSRSGNGSFNHSIVLQTTNGDILYGDTDVSGTQTLSTFVADGTSTYFWIDGVSETVNVFGDPDAGLWFSTRPYPLVIGGIIRSANAFGTGKYKEIILFPDDQTANRAEIEAEINGFYSIY